MREAVALANQQSGVDTITFDANLNGAIVLNNGEIEITDGLIINGNGADNLTIDGNANSRIFKLDDGSSESELDIAIDGLTITNGNVAGQGDSNGGGILNLENLFLSNSKVTANTAEQGGGIANQGNLTIQSSQLDSNFASVGAGLYSTSGSNQIIESQVSQNQASVSHGGIYGDSLFLEIKNSSVKDNSAEESAGGLGVSNALANIIDSSVTGNLSNGEGGGIVSTSASTNIDNSAIAANIARSQSGGGILTQGSAVTINNSTITANSADNSAGGGIFNGLQSFTNVNNSTIADNVAPVGAGVIQQDAVVAEDGSVTAGTLNLTSTIVADNSGNNDLGGDVINSNGNSLIGNGDNVGTFNSTVSDLVGTTDNPLDPRLGELQDNSGATQTIELLTDSSAVDAGSNLNGLTTDQRGAGFDRTIGAGTDIGAFELQTARETEDPVVFPDELVVSTLTDEADDDFSAGDLSLREAIALANQKEGIDEITFAGDLNGSIVLNLGQIEITEGVAVLGNGADNLAIDGNGSDRLFFIDDGNEAPTDVAFSNLTLTNGNVAGREADNSGGAIFNRENLFIFDSKVIGNSAEQGGGIANQGSVVVQNSELSGNIASVGGGLYSTSGFNQFVNSTISNNQASFNNGGISADSLFLEIKDSIIENNTADASGGGIGVNNSLANISNTQIRDNTAGATGGGFAVSSSETNLSDSTISGNSAAQSGGINVGSSTARISNSTIFGNSATVNEGGGIGSSAQSTTTVNNTTIAGNEATEGAGIYRQPAITTEDGVVDGEFNLTSSLVANNANNRDVSGGVIISGGNNLIGNGDGGQGVFDPAQGDLIGTADNPIDPRLGGLEDNGGATPTVALLPGSIAINAGSNPNDLSTDQRGAGFDRTIGDGTDIGAFEVQNIEEPPAIDPNLLTVSTLSDDNDGNFSEGNLSLREAIALAASGATINFDSSLSGGTIVLSSGELAIDRSLTINGLGANQLSISGDNKFRTFRIDNGDFDTQAEVIIDGLTIRDAEGFGDGSLGLDGGGFFNQENLTLRNADLINNSAVNGGAIFNQGNLQLENSLIAENFGGTAPILNNGGQATIINTTITNNATGGISAIDNTLGSVLNLSNSTIADNNGFDAAVAVGGSNATIVSTIIARNSGSADPDRDDVIGTFNSGGNNLIGNGNGGDGFDAAGDLVGTADNPLDPNLEPLQDNGGATLTRALPSNSIAIDAGSNPNNLTTDRRGVGFDRTSGAGTDIGAFELQTVTPPTPPTPINEPTANDDNLFGTDIGDIISGLGGNDTLFGLGGDDTLLGLSGNDLLDGGAGNDSLDGGVNNDTLFGSEGRDTLFGDRGNDLLDGGGGRDSLNGGVGNDTLLGLGSRDTLFGDRGNDLLDGGAGRDSLNGGVGNDTLLGLGGNDTLFGDRGDDLLDGGAGRDSLNGGTGRDRILGNNGNDVIFGDNDDDSIFGGAGNDTLNGGAG